MVEVKNFSVVNAAFCIRLMAECVDHKDALFLVIVNGVNFNPERIFGKTASGLTFVGNNSGYFNWLIEEYEVKEIYENHINRDVNGLSFGGKYVQVPTAAKILAGFEWKELGFLREASFLNSSVIPENTAVHIDNFGLIKIKSSLSESLKCGDKLAFFVNGVHKVDGHYTTKMKQEKDGSWVLFKGSSLYGLAELGCVRAKNSALMLGIEEGDIVTWKTY
ncbi:SAM-dependent chlorinase/fluorinase [Candidatus Odyssella thessalonicensis]|uniref:SAM-dependent chlorinase/fluorinase n=1 Tax=Candidatus Odyssella thessalonicensis TaxID=84647 RepID=UPI0011122B9E|nr:SAM-dependent chlorinase/fluorinase [Candidatus Odyssella thessalonicensis]